MRFYPIESSGQSKIQYLSHTPFLGGKELFVAGPVKKKKDWFSEAISKINVLNRKASAVAEKELKKEPPVSVSVEEVKRDYNSRMKDLDQKLKDGSWKPSQVEIKFKSDSEKKSK